MQKTHNKIQYTPIISTLSKGGIIISFLNSSTEIHLHNDKELTEKIKQHHL